MNNSKNNVVFCIPNLSNSRTQENDIQYNNDKSLSNNMKQDKTRFQRTNENTEIFKHDYATKSSTMISSLKDTATHSSLSSTTLNKFNNNNLEHEKKHLSRKKLKNVQHQLENRLNLKSATTNSFYKELNKITEDEKTLAQVIKIWFSTSSFSLIVLKIVFESY